MEDLYLGKTNYKVIGQRPIRHDGADKVTGKAIYTADLQLPNMAHGKLIRSPHAHAKIKRIDVSQALAVPGVLAVVTADDFPDLAEKIAMMGEAGAVNLQHLAGNCLAKDKVLYKGHAVAAVAAINTHVAEEAAKKIVVEYEPLPSVTWVLDAMKPDAPILHDDLRTDELGQKGDKPTNVSVHIAFEQGNPAEGFKQAEIIVEREFRTASVHQGYIEPHAAVAMWNEDGRLKIWTATQGSFTCRQQTAELLQIPVSQVLVVPCEIGGGFGGKIAVYLEPVAALLSRKCGRPVKMTMQRAEVFEGTGPTPGSYMRVKLGAKKDGTLVAGEAWLAYDCGAFPGGMIGPGSMCVFSCYDIPHARVDGYDVLNNKPKVQAYRAPGSTQAAFATEQVIDELALQLKLDPIEIRLKNAAKEGTRRVDGPVYPRIGFIETLEAARNSEHWKSPLTGKNRGRGIASGFWFNIGGASSCSASVMEDGTVSLIEGSTDIGGTRTSIAMQLAETLGITSDDVRPQVADTDSVGYTFLTGGSRVTFATGLAAYKLGLDLQAQMRDRAARLWKCSVDEVQVEDGTYSYKDQKLTFKELAAKLAQSALEPVVGRSSVNPEGSTNGFATHIADVEVDPETGKVTILRYTAIQDAGKAIHPSYVEGQMQGGAVQGIGWAMNEEYFFDKNDQMRNASFLDYRMPTCLDVPMIETIIVEVPNPGHPFGVRGVGEAPIVPPPAAMANAIQRATGIRFTDLPMSPPKVWKALQK
ncbi:4-hydroxybenzoyl-CoA reductase subunit alpha [Anatilimnocola aggregata]|uniref:4-hydroxybenzoyl-CoA reductase subunit alpha n=1 Tax=Anatilimnocola aggregata TaxID=2528021 RepID=A0A517Y603_9BACT|nr:xanthine dehydrogenase family protein molybdopterin-binding subunit [Anatilimnocola aggregata]QDU25669.1 4-hydroxybenzoyl-CoA reductase subunit alpha [Anatilimnocola aggregata]